MNKQEVTVKLFEDKVYNNKSGLWYRFWWRFLLGAEFEKHTGKTIKQRNKHE